MGCRWAGVELSRLKEEHVKKSAESFAKHRCKLFIVGYTMNILGDVCKSSCSGVLRLEANLLILKSEWEVGKWREVSGSF